jgi:hypothetical protein
MTLKTNPTFKPGDLIKKKVYRDSGSPYDKLLGFVVETDSSGTMVLWSNGECDWWDTEWFQYDFEKVNGGI